MISFRKFQNFEEAEPIKSEWDRFVETQTSDIFLTYDWCRIWWKYYGKKREPLLFVFRNDGQICGVLPMFREKIRLGPFSARVVKLMCTDYSPVTVSIAIRTENLEAVIRLLLEELQKLHPWDIIFFGALCGRYPDTDLLSSILENHLGEKYSIRSRQSDVQTYFQIESDWEKQLLSMNTDNRTKMRRVHKTIRDRDLQLYSKVVTNENISEMFARMVDTHQAQWNEIGMPGHFTEWPMAIQYHREMAQIQAENGRLRLMEVWLSEKPIGYQYLYRFGDTYLEFITGRTHYEDEKKIHFHRVSFSEKFRMAIRENVHWIDAMRGQYDYKREMGGKLFPVMNIYTYAKYGSRSLNMNLFFLFTWILNVCYSKVWRRRVMPRAGIKSRQFLDLWVRTHCFTK